MAGLYFEEFEIGRVFKHAITRTITETDNLIFYAPTHTTQAASNIRQKHPFRDSARASVSVSSVAGITVSLARGSFHRQAYIVLG